MLLLKPFKGHFFDLVRIETQCREGQCSDFEIFSLIRHVRGYFRTWGDPSFGGTPGIFLGSQIKPRFLLKKFLFQI